MAFHDDAVPVAVAVAVAELVADIVTVGVGVTAATDGLREPDGDPDCDVVPDGARVPVGTTLAVCEAVPKVERVAATLAVSDAVALGLDVGAADGPLERVAPDADDEAELHRETVPETVDERTVDGVGEAESERVAV